MHAFTYSRRAKKIDCCKRLYLLKQNKNSHRQSHRSCFHWFPYHCWNLGPNPASSHPEKKANHPLKDPPFWLPSSSYFLPPIRIRPDRVISYDVTSRRKEQGHQVFIKFWLKVGWKIGTNLCNVSWDCLWCSHGSDVMSNGDKENMAKWCGKVVRFWAQLES